MSSVAALPPEIISLIIELAVLTSPPCSSNGSTDLTGTPADQPAPSPFSSPLSASEKSDWSQLTSLLYVSRLFYTLARPLLLRTLTLNTTKAGLAFFDQCVASSGEAGTSSTDLAYVRRGWLGNITALKRLGVDPDPICLKLDEAGWFEECPGGFVVGHTYASRPRTPKPRNCADASGVTNAATSKGKKGEKRFQRVSVYWAEEQLIEEVPNPSDLSGDDDDLDDEEAYGDVSSLYATPSGPPADRYAEQSLMQGQRLQQLLTGDPRIDRPHEPAWQTLYRRTNNANSRNASGRAEGSNSSRNGPTRRGRAAPPVTPSGNLIAGWVGTHGPPAEGEIDPWEMWEAQERLAALPTPSTAAPLLEPFEPDAAQKVDQVLDAHLLEQRRRLRRTEIYAYHLCTATLEPWINPLFTSIRTLRYITLTFTPGHILDDDKLEHMLRRILTRAENPRLEVLLIRMVFEPSVAGSRMRRFERAKTIGGAVDRIADERVRVMLVASVVGQGLLVQTPSETCTTLLSVSASDKQSSSATEITNETTGFLSPLSRRAVAITQEAWWSRVLQQNRFYAPAPCAPALSFKKQSEPTLRPTSTPSSSPREHVPPWTSFFGYDSGRAEWMGKTVSHCNPWPDDPIPLEHPHYQAADPHTTPTALSQSRQLNYINGWAARDRENTNAPIEE